MYDQQLGSPREATTTDDQNIRRVSSDLLSENRGSEALSAPPPRPFARHLQMANREEAVYMAKLAEQSERYDEMMREMASVAKLVRKRSRLRAVARAVR